MPTTLLLRHLMSRVAEDRLLLALLLALPVLMWLQADATDLIPTLIDWKTIGALAGLMVLSRGLEDSGYLALGGRRLLTRIHDERMLAMALVLFSAALSAVVTNDVALFIVVPLTLGLRLVARLPIGRLIIFEALAVNAGSTLSPVGNPQNLFIWQSTALTFMEFVWMMLPLGLALTGLIVLTAVFAFPAHRITATPGTQPPALNRPLFILSLSLYPLFLLLADTGHAIIGALAIIVLYALLHRRVLRGVDWVLLAVFVLMFVDLGLLASLQFIQSLGAHIDSLPGGVFAASVALSQVISNVPASIFLSGFTEDLASLTWGVSVGGFGLAIGSLANLIALRLSREPGLWREFHLWSIPTLGLAAAVASILKATGF